MRHWLRITLFWLALNSTWAMALAPAPAVNQPAPGLSLPLVTGGQVDLRSLRGRVVLVNFWATWCPTCLMEMPSLNRLAYRLRGSPFVILGVNAGESSGWVKGFMNKVALNFPVALDAGRVQMSAWQAIMLPTSFLVDKLGRIRYVRVGPAEWDSPEMLAIMNQLIRE